MPAYAAASAVDLLPGQTVALINNAAVDTGVSKTIAVQVKGKGTVNVVNTTNQDVTGQIAPDDLEADYQPAVGLVVVKATSLPYNMASGFLRFTCTAPTSGSLYVSLD